MDTTYPMAPELQTERWFNTVDAISLAGLRGKVVIVHAFQMLCPGCVYHSIPQAIRQAAQYNPQQVAVLGLHSVFEHHSVMTPAALAVFLHEFRLRFPVAVDAPGDDGPIPKTMHLYGMRGTPTLLLIDALGRLRAHQFGQVEDEKIDGAVSALLAEAAA